MYRRTAISPGKLGRIDPSQWRSYSDHYTASIWPADLPSKPANYGDNKFHGRTHPDIIKVALERYTKPGEWVWDCMAGSGTVMDVCTELSNPCVSTDLTPIRPEIIQADCRLWKPEMPIDLVVCHPPYMDIINYQDNVLSTSDLDKYLQSMEAVFRNIHKVLNPGRVMVLIIGTVYKEGEVLLLDSELHPLYIPMFKVLGRVVRPFGETKGGITTKKKDANMWKYRKLNWGLWDLDQDIVLFLQSV